MKKYFILLSVSILLHTGASAAVIKEITLEEMQLQAGTILSGVCIDSGKTAGGILYYTFKPRMILKGAQRDTVTVRIRSTAAHIARAPVFHVGEEVLLFLYPESSSGFTSPVGFGQGKFSIRTSAGGKKLAVNERNNQNLFKNMDASGYLKNTAAASIKECSAARSGPVSYDELIALIKAMVKKE